MVASPLEVAAIRRACGGKFLTVVPGIRPAAFARDDQSRIATPAEAIRAGADYLVVGRPITEAKDPRAAAKAILEEMSSALAGGHDASNQPGGVTGRYSNAPASPVLERAEQHGQAITDNHSTGRFGCT